jgi:thiol-disulfide isomerase/thioredoxin
MAGVIVSGALSDSVQGCRRATCNLTSASPTMRRMDMTGWPTKTRVAMRSGSASRRKVLRMAAVSAAISAWPGFARAGHVVRAWPAGMPTPALALTDTAGTAWSLAALRGKVVVLNFWASWCEPCRTEMPSLELLAGHHKRDGLVVLALNFKEALPAIQRFLALQPVSLPILLDPDGTAAAAWTPGVFPTTVLIDRDGAPRTQVLGDLDWLGADARALIAPLLVRAKAT